MKCEICHTAEAEQAIIKKAKGQPDQELYVCAACAVDARLAEHEEKLNDLNKKVKCLPKKQAKREREKKGEDSLPELMGMIIDATLEIMNHSVQPQEPVCPHCGVTRTEYRKASRLGCAVCYETFTEELESLIADMHYIPRHVGKAPKLPVPSKQVQKLMRKLTAAEREQRADDADALRTAIRALGWEPDTPKGEA